MLHDQKKSNWKKEAAMAYIGGGLYGATTALVGHPFDTVKTKMQAQSEFMGAGNTYVGAIKNVYKQDGFRGFYRGWIPPLMGAVIYRSSQFAAFEAAYARMEDTPSLTNAIPGTSGLQPRVILAGMFAGSVRSIVECPTEYIKVKQQTKQAWAVRDLYKGYGILWPRATLLIACFFIQVDTYKRKTDLMKYKLG